MTEHNEWDGRIAGIVLAGGAARRLGGDKALRLLGGKTLLDHAISRARPQVAALAVSANSGDAAYRAPGLPVLADSAPGLPGPLAGILAGMDWAASSGMAWLASFPCDAPFFPRDLVARLTAARAAGQADIACAASGGRTHPVFALWPARLREELRRALRDEGLRKVETWAARYRVVTVAIPAEPFDPFLNINTPDDLSRAETLLAALRSADNDGAGSLGGT